MSDTIAKPVFQLQLWHLLLLTAISALIVACGTYNAFSCIVIAPISIGPTLGYFAAQRLLGTLTGILSALFLSVTICGFGTLYLLQNLDPHQSSEVWFRLSVTSSAVIVSIIAALAGGKIVQR